LNARLMAIFQETRVSRYQTVYILDFVWAQNDRGSGDNSSYKTCKAPVKSSPPTNQHFYMPNVLPAAAAQPTVSQHWRENDNWYNAHTATENKFVQEVKSSRVEVLTRDLDRSDTWERTNDRY